MASKWVTEQKRAEALKAKQKKQKEEKKRSQLPVRSPDCEVCKAPTRNFNARINIRTPNGNLLTIGICGDCVRRGYTFDKQATVILRSVEQKPIR